MSMCPPCQILVVNFVLASRCVTPLSHSIAAVVVVFKKTISLRVWGTSRCGWLIHLKR